MVLFGFVILGYFGCVEQIRGSIRMRYFGFLVFRWTDWWIYSNARFWVLWVVWVVLNKLLDLFGWVILGFLGSAGKIHGFIRMRYFEFFGFSWTDSLIYSDALFWVVSVELNKFVDLFGLVILVCLGSVEQIRGSIWILFFGFFGFRWTDWWIYSNAPF